MLLVFLMSSSAWAQGRIATVDLRKLFDNYWKTKQADAVLKDQQTDVDKELKSMVEELKKANEDYQNLLADANNMTFSLDERERRKKSAEEKFKEMKESEDTLAQYRRRATTTLQEQAKRMRSSLVEDIRTIIKGNATASGYALVIDTAAEGVNNTPFVLYSNNENDISDAVLAQLNAGAPPAGPAKSGEKATDNKDDGKK